MSSPEPQQDLGLDRYTASRGLGCLAVAGLAVLSLFLSVLGICVQPSPIFWLTRLLGGDGGAFIAAVLIIAAVIFFAIYIVIAAALRDR
ncbi:hypothetical protein [Dongia sp.]|uniref:hypothetical protein n=1 Tax=Dongia sp. TaxID=1977262 RepID=UPI00374FE9EF